ncbi:hypothetical protein PR003_g22174 [Phytophthora rubi]|uniref:Uncharacterized protein n=1 Tax=Phytophthora rubi TaxID=129364 RepID=A0A6A4DA84_9STRA|nr:hypothetical protein PR003_g22174 [Phytophthora rubi]
MKECFLERAAKAMLVMLGYYGGVIDVQLEEL